MHVTVKSLPPIVRRALESVGYAHTDIAIEARERVWLADAGSAGQRAFAVILDLATGQALRLNGSWGGPNMFRDTVVDSDDRERVLTPGLMVIKGSEGNRTYATIYVHPENMAPLLPSSPTIDDRDARVLACYRGLKSGPYRKEALARLNCTDADIARLVAAGLLKQSSNGATQITTAGKNACAHVRGML
jgi:hypothetical protein